MDVRDGEIEARGPASIRRAITSQRRLRQVREMVWWVSPASGPEEPHRRYQVQLHRAAEASTPLWTSPPAAASAWGHVVWSDLSFHQSSLAHLVGLVLHLEVSEPGTEATFRSLDRVVLHLSGLNEASFHPQRGRLTLQCRRDEALASPPTVVLRALPPGHAASYDTRLLSRLQRIRRALAQQEVQNRLYCQSLQHALRASSPATGLGPESEAVVPLSRRILAPDKKKGATRQRERQLRARIERMEMRVRGLQAGLTWARARHRTLMDQAFERHSANDMHSQILTAQVYEFSKSRSLVQSALSAGVAPARSQWEQCRISLHQLRRHIMSQCLVIFPMPPGDRSIRWVPMVDLAGARGHGHQETTFAVLHGWLAQLVSLLAQLHDLPLKYPLHVFGSFCQISDPLAPPHHPPLPGGMPLFIRGSDPAQVERGVACLNKDLLQLCRMYGVPVEHWDQSVINMSALLGGARK